MADQMTEYQRRLVDILVLAKFARTEEERARHFITAEEWSAQARETPNSRHTTAIFKPAEGYQGV